MRSLPAKILRHKSTLLIDKKVIIAIALFLAGYSLWITFRPAKIVRVESGVVFVKHLPLTTRGKLDWWLENKNMLERKYHIFATPNNFTVVIMNFGGYEALPKGVRGGSIDDYTCYDNNTKCIYNDIAIIIRGSISGKMFVNIGDKTFLQTNDGKVLLQ